MRIEYDTKTKQIKMYEDDLQIIKDVEIRCRYCGEVIDISYIHEAECRKKQYKKLNTVEERLSFLAKELGLI